MPHQPRKRFGQNFLVDEKIINQIILTISPKQNDNIIEIGPGKGALTFPMLENLNSLNVIEIDRDLVALLKSKKEEKLEIYEADALYFDFAVIDNKFRVIGNCLLYTSPSPRDRTRSRMPSSA